MPKRTRISAIGALAMIAFLVVACSDPSGPDDGPDANGGVARATIGVEGGNLELEDSGSVRLALSVPPAALLTETPIEIERVDPGPSGVDRYRFRPAGLRFAEAVTLRWIAVDEVGPEDVSLSFGEGSDRVALPVSIEGTTVVASLASLGFEPEGLGRRTGDVFLDIQQIDCQLELASLETRFEYAKLSAFSVDSVEKLKLQHTVVLQCAGALSPALIAAKVEEIREEACAARTNALVDLQVDLEFVDEVANMRQRVSGVLGSEGAAVHFGAACLGDSLVMEGIGTAYEVFSENFRERVAAPDFLSGPGAWSTHWGTEFQEAIGLLEDAGTMGLEDVEAETRHGLFPEMLDQFRRAAWDAAVEDNTQQYLADIKTAGHLFGAPISGIPEVPDWANFTEDDVVRDIQYCRSEVEVQVYEDLLGTSLPDEWVTLGGFGPGDYLTQEEIDVPADGLIVLDGSVTALLCAGENTTSQFADDTLVIRADDVVLATMGAENGELLGTPVDISIEQVLEDLGLSETEVEQFTITVTRESDACDGIYGPSEFELFEIDVNSIGCPPTQIVGTGAAARRRIASDQCAPSGPLVVTFPDWPDVFSPSGNEIQVRVGYDQGESEEPLWVEGIEIEVENNGTPLVAADDFYAEPGAGVSDVDGYFTAVVRVGPSEGLPMRIFAIDPDDDTKWVRIDSPPMPKRGVFLERWDIRQTPKGSFYRGSELFFDEESDDPEILEFEGFADTSRVITASGSASVDGNSGSFDAESSSTIEVAADAMGNLQSLVGQGSGQVSGSMVEANGDVGIGAVAGSTLQFDFRCVGEPASYSISASLAGTRANLRFRAFNTGGGDILFWLVEDESQGFSDVVTLSPGVRYRLQIKASPRIDIEETGSANSTASFQLNVQKLN